MTEKKSNPPAIRKTEHLPAVRKAPQPPAVKPSSPAAKVEKKPTKK